MLEGLLLQNAQKIVKGKAPGFYTLRELFGDEWQHVKRPRFYGRCFKAAVLHDDIPKVELFGKKSNKSLLYEVKAWSGRH